MPYLKLIDSATHRAFEIREALVWLGRSTDCTVVFRGDTAGVVSGVHAELRHAGGEWRVADLASRNGTFVNTRRIDAPVVLRSYAELTMGPCSSSKASVRHLRCPWRVGPPHRVCAP